MKRRANRVPIEHLARDLGIADPARCSLYVDEQNRANIEEVLSTEQNQKKFRRILYEVFNFRYNDDLYRKEWQSSDEPHITAMKFSDRNNTRIYCREFDLSDGRRVVMLQAVAKKSQKNDRRIRDRISAYGAYEYEFD